MMVYAPNYPIACCPAHSVRIMPEFVRHMCMTDEQNNLYFITYGPCHISYEGISLHVTTEYPFRDTIHFQFENTSGKSFTLFLRVPDWCSEPSLLVNGCKHSAEVNADGFLEIDGIWEPSDSITLQLPMKVHTSVLSDNNHKHPVFIERGPLVFSKKIDFMWYETQERGYTPLPEGWHWYEASANVNFLHHEAQKAFDFNYALTKKKLDQITVTETAYTYPWEEAPIVLQITAEKAKHMFPPYPIKTHDLYQNPTDTDGIETQIELVPYGCTNLRITYFPTAVSKEDVSL